MAKHILKIREIDRNIFEAIKQGRKTIETRAAVDKYRKIVQGDVLEFVCGKDRLSKKVIGVSVYKDIETLVKNLDIKKIMPDAFSIEEAKVIWLSFPKYEEKIKKYGLVAFQLDNSD